MEMNVVSIFTTTQIGKALGRRGLRDRKGAQSTSSTPEYADVYRWMFQYEPLVNCQITSIMKDTVDGATDWVLMIAIQLKS